ncbi:MAG: GNAT family N-acetyltransferase [Planctomycetota bacterium]|nr:GNAT family N-acetyltransferase [Planctomycetota bacterium]MDA1251820.1 GNAT family N-acetyltransferase [Planctomycetota bacterium]
MNTQLENQQQAVRLEVRSSDVRDFVLSEWRRLEARIGDRGLSCSSDWTEVWLDAYGDLVPHRFLMAIDSEDGQLVGICLITEGVEQKDGPLPIRTLHVGTAGEPDGDSVCVEYNRLLVEPRFEHAFAEQIVSHLEAQSGFDQWNLDGFAEADLAAFLPEEAGNAAVALELTRQPTHWFDLKTTRNEGKDILSSLKSGPRRKVKQSFKGYDEVTVDFAESLDQASEIFSELMELHQARWNSVGKPGSYSSERFVRFHEGLLARLVPQGRMALIRVRTGGCTLGCVQVFIEHGRVLLYQCGWAPAEGTKSPGVVLDYVTMKKCFDRGYSAYDFLAFATQHKRQLSNQCHDMIWARRKHPRLKFAVLDKARRLKQMLKRNPEES